MTEGVDPASRRKKLAGCLHLTFHVLFELFLGLLQLGVVVATYVVAGVLGAGWTLVANWPATVAVGFFDVLVGGLVVPAALTFGLVAWVLPATVREWARAEADADYPIPTRAEGLLFALASAVAATVAASVADIWVLDSGAPWVVLGLVAVTTISAAVIVLAGARRVAALWLMILATMAEGAAN